MNIKNQRLLWVHLFFKQTLRPLCVAGVVDAKLNNKYFPLSRSSVISRNLQILTVIFKTLRDSGTI